jgi:hypothetical protein
MELARTVAFALALLTVLSAAAVPAYFGRKKPGYSHLRHTISELGEAGSPHAGAVSFGFAGIGILLWLFLAVAAYATPGTSTPAYWQLSLVGVGYVGGGAFRCDPGAPAVGTWRNTCHVICGALEYVGAAAAFSSLAAAVRGHGAWSVLSPLMALGTPVILVCFWAITIPHGLRGFVQRVAETIIFAGIAVTGLWVYLAPDL